MKRIILTFGVLALGVGAASAANFTLRRSMQGISSGEAAPGPETARVSCAAHHAAGLTTSGIFAIDPDGAGGIAQFNAYCDQTTEGGGWMKIIQSDTTGNRNLPTSTGATGDLTVSGSQAKLADATINAMKTADTVFRFDHDLTGSNYYIRGASSAWNNAARAFGIGSGSRHDCLSPSLTDCAWVPTSHSMIDTQITVARPDNCLRYFTDVQATPECYPNLGGRCISSGQACSRPGFATYAPAAVVVWIKNVAITPTVLAHCKAWKQGGFNDSGVYRIDGAGAFTAVNAYCDMTSDGGGWTLIELGRNNGSANLRTNSAVGFFIRPVDQTVSAKLSRAQAAGVMNAGDNLMKLGHPANGYLYITLQPSWSSGGYGSLAGNGYGTIISPNIMSGSLGGATYGQSRFAWGNNDIPAACLNSNGGSGECDAGLHVGRWTLNCNDCAYINHSGGPNGQRPYEVWAR